MTKPWSEVAASEGFKSLPPEQQDGARRQYFDDVVAPKVPTNQRDVAWDQFSTDVGVGRRELPAGIAPSTAGGGRGSVNPPMSLADAGPSRAQRIAEMDAVTDPMNPASTQVSGGERAALQPKTVLEQPLRNEDQPAAVGPGRDAMLNPEFIHSFRQELGSLPVEKRLAALKAYAETDKSVYGRAARVILAEEESQNQQVTEEGKREGKRLLSPGTPPALKPGKGKARDAAFPDATPNFVERFDGITDKEVAGANEIARGAAGVREAIKTDAKVTTAKIQSKADEGRSAGQWASDTWNAVNQGTISLAQLPLNIVAPSSLLADSLRETQKELSAKESDVLQSKRKLMADRIKNESGFLDQYLTTIYSLVSDPALAVQEGVKQLPNFIGVLGAAKLAAAGAGGLVSAAGRLAPATVGLGEAISGGAINAAAQSAGATAGGIGASMVMAGGDAAGNTYERLTDPKQTPVSTWEKNPDYQKLIASGATSQDAIKEIATAKARMAALITAPLGVFGFMGAESAMVNSGIRRAVSQAGKPQGAAKIIGKELLGEQAEEGLTQAGSNLATRTVDPSQSMLEGVPQAMGTAAVVSGPFAGVAVATEKMERQPAGGFSPASLNPNLASDRERIKRLKAAGETDVADMLERRANLQEAEANTATELQELTKAAPQFAEHPLFQQAYKAHRIDGVKPAEAAARAAITTGFGELAAQAGLSQKATDAALDAAKKMPIAKVPGFLERYVGTLASKGMGQAPEPGSISGPLSTVGDTAMTAAVDSLYANEVRSTMAAVEDLESQQNPAAALETPAPAAIKSVADDAKTEPARASQQPQAEAAPAQAAKAPEAAAAGGAAAGTPAGDAAVQAAGIDGKQVYQIGGRDPSTRTYEHRADGRLSRTIAYPDGQNLTETLVTDKQGDDHWVSTTQYQKGEYFPVQLSQEKAEAAIRDDLAGTSATPKIAPATAPVAPQPTARQIAIQAEKAKIEAGKAAPKPIDPRLIPKSLRDSNPEHIGKDNTPLVDGGKPFKTNREAKLAQKQQPMMRVVKAGKGKAAGYALAPKTEKQIAAQEKAGARLGRGNTGPAGQPISAHSFIADKGGLAPEARADMGMDGNQRIGSRWLFAGAGKGLTIERATEYLVEEGYLQEGASHSQALALIKRSLTQPQYTPEGTERMALAEAEANFADHLAAQEEAAQNEDPFDSLAEDGFDPFDIETTGYDELSDPIKLEVNALLALAESKGIDTDSIKEQAYEDTRNGSEQDYYEAAKSALTQAVAESDGGGRQDSGAQGDAGSQAGVAPPADTEGLKPTNSLSRTASWVIRDKAAGTVIMETFDRKKVDALNTEKYEAVPIGEYLGDLNKTPAFDSKLRPDGTLAITGDAKAIRELLAAIPAKSLVAMKGGILVGRTQADKATAILRGEKPKLTAREAAEAGQATREADKKAKAAAARAKPAAGGLTVGIMPGNAEAVTIKDGVVYIGKTEALDFDSGEPVRVKDGASDSEIVNALKVAGALSRRQRVFGLKEDAAPRNDAEGPSEFTHNGTRIYPIKMAGRDGAPPTMRWAVESADNKQLREEGDRNRGGDSLHTTIEEAKKAAEFEAKQDQQKKDRLEGIAASEKAEKDAADARREANKGKSLMEIKAQKYMAETVKDGATGEEITRAEWVKRLVDGGEKPSIEMVNKIKPLSRNAYNRATNQEQAAHEKKIRDGGKVPEYSIGNYIVSKTEYDYAQTLASEGLTSPTQQEVLDQQDRKDNADSLDQREQIGREASGQSLTSQTAPEQRTDTSGDMFAAESDAATQSELGNLSRAQQAAGEKFADATPAAHRAEADRISKVAAGLTKLPDIKRRYEALAESHRLAADRKEDGQGSMFARGRADDERDLVIQHNLTADNLLHADRMGGLAVPSLAITKAAQPMQNFGEITLLGDRNMADPKQGIKAYGADIYSPRYPTISYNVTPKALAALNEMLAPYRKEGDRPIYGSEISNLEDLTQNSAFRQYAMKKLDKKDVWDLSYHAMQPLAGEMLTKAGAEERLFQGFTYSGNRRYKPHTLENVIAILKKELRGGENFNYGAGSLRAKFTPQFRSIEAIKKAKGSLVTKEQFEAIKDEVNNELVSIAEDMNKPTDTVIAIFEDAPRMGLQRAAKQYDIDLGDTMAERMGEFLTRLRNMPTEYFEGKFLRSVGIGEFKAAVVPSDVKPAALKLLEREGVKVFTYQKGDEADRTKVLQRAAAETPDALFARGVWRSELSAQITGSQMNASQPAGWKTYIDGLTKKGVKPDEIEWSGVREWLDLQPGKVTKAQILEFLNGNGVKVEETMLGGGQADGLAERRAELQAMSREDLRDEAEMYDVDPDEGNRADIIANILEEQGAGEEDNSANQTKYHSYQLPGGQNYRELLLTLPVKQSLPDGMSAVEKPSNPPQSRWIIIGPGPMEENRYGSGPTRDAAIASAIGHGHTGAYKSGHWDQKNILAHIRFNERTDADGNRVLFIEEIQSDWGQAGKKQGFAAKVMTNAERQAKKNEARRLANENRARANADRAAGLEQISDETLAINRATSDKVSAIMRELEADEAQKLNNLSGAVPNAPFVGKTDAWVALAIKRMVSYAAENGFDRVAFVNGEQSAERYDLSKQINSLRVRKNTSGNYTIQTKATAEDRTFGTLKSNVTADELPDMIGKELAAKVIRDVEALEQQPKLTKLPEGYSITMDRKSDPEAPFTVTPDAQVHSRPFAGRHATEERAIKAALELLELDRTDGVVYSGLDLKVGGEGMKAFYDKIVPAVAKDVLRKLGGGQMGEVEIYKQGILGKALPDDAKPAARRDGRLFTQSGFDITPAMREKATAGLPLFARQGFDADAFSRMFSPPSAMAVSDVQKAVDQLTSKWKSGPTIKVVATPADLPIDAPADARGLIHNGTAYIVARNHVNRDAVARTLGHEAVGHYGLWRMLGDEGTTRFNRNLQLALKSGNVPLNKLRDKVRAAYVDGKGKFNLSAAEESSEIAAFAVEDAIDPATGEFKPGFGFVKEVYAKVAEFLRSLGIDIKFTNSELHGMLVSAMRGLEAGHKLDGGAEVLVAAARTPPAALQPIQTPVGTAFQSDDVVLGKPRLNVRQPGGDVTRVDFEIRDPQRFAAAKAAGATPAQARDAANVGVLTMDMDKAGQFRSLRNIEVFESKRGDGLAGKVVGSIMGTLPEGGKLHIHDILPTATGFWDKMGAKFARSDDYMEAFLTPAQFRSAYANTETRAAGEKGPSDKPGPTLYARSGKGGSGDDGQAAGEAPAAGAKGVTDTPAFKKWFGDSKVVDDAGKPLVVYHGTNADVDQFDTKAFSNGEKARLGAYFTSDERVARHYGDKTLSVYLSIKNPFDIAGMESLDAIKQMPVSDRLKQELRSAFRAADANQQYGMLESLAGRGLREALEAAGYDGIKYTEAYADSYIAFRPEQIKSAIGNNGDFDGSNPNIAFARGTGNLFQPNIWSMPDATRTDRVIYELQDGKVDLKRAQQAIKASGQTIKEEFDARLAETLYPGRVAYRSATFLDVEAKPLLEAMARNNVGMDELADYLHARGAEERNAQIAKVNPNMPDGGAGTNTKGELMTNQAARDYLAAVNPTRKVVLDAMAKRVDTITAGTRALLVAEGLEKQETIDAWEGAYKNYVPMFRDEAETGMPPHPQGSGFQVKGSASKRATGSTKEVTNILAHVLMQREAAITRAEKNRVALALYGQALSHPNPDFWTTIRPGMKAAEISAELVAMGVDPMTAQVGMEGVPTIRTVDPVTNKVVDRPNPIYRNLPGAIPLKVNGADRVLMLNVKTERGMRLATSLKNLDGLTQLDIAGNIIGKSTRWLAAVNTQYNPAFGLVNLTRDTLGGAINLGSTELRGNALKVLAKTPLAILGIARELASGGQTGTWQSLYRQFQADGGQTGWKESFRDPNDRAKAVEKELAALGSAKLSPGRAAHAILDLLDGFNTTLENAVRLSAYKAALDKGISRAEAARLGRELTVDFNRKGRAGREVGPLYAFFNASVQGGARTIEALKGPTGGRIIAGGIALGILQALMLAAADYDDDEIPEFVKTRALIIPLFGREKKYISIPYPLGLHVLPNTGRVLAELTLNGGKDIAKRSVAAIGEIAGAFNPLGGGNIFTADGALKTVAPTTIDPLIEIGFNRNFAGGTIEKTGYGGETDNRPGVARTKESTQRTTTGQAYMAISAAINKLTGGTDYEAGLASPTPERVRYIAQTVGGGVLREFEKTINSSVAAARGEKVKMSGIPVAGRFYGEVDDDQAQTSRYFNSARTMRKIESSVKAATKAGDLEAADKIEDRNPEAALIRTFNRTQRAIAALNKEAVQTIGNREEMAQIDKDRAQLMREFNEDLAELERESGKITLADRLRTATRPKMAENKP